VPCFNAENFTVQTHRRRKTDSMFSRYNIVEEDDLRKALKRTEQYREASNRKSY
jgi:hypothetical protein